MMVEFQGCPSGALLQRGEQGSEWTEINLVVRDSKKGAIFDFEVPGLNGSFAPTIIIININNLTNVQIYVY